MRWSLPADALDRVDPIKLAVFLLAGTVATIMIYGNLSSDEEIEWLIATSGLGLYAWLVSVISFFNPSWGKYTLRAVVCFPIFAVAVLSAAYFVSSTNILDMVEYQLMLVATTIFFGVATVISKVIQGLTFFFEAH